MHFTPSLLMLFLSIPLLSGDYHNINRRHACRPTSLCKKITATICCLGVLGGTIAGIVIGFKSLNPTIPPCTVTGNNVTGDCCAAVAFKGCDPCPNVPMLVDDICIEQSVRSLDEVRQRAQPVLQELCGGKAEFSVLPYACKNYPRCTNGVEYKLHRAPPKSNPFCVTPTPIPPH